jgi:hypothetical protein
MTNNMIIDLGTNQLTFLDTRYYITEEGGFVPSVTTYLEAYPKSAQFFEWLKQQGDKADEIRDEAGRRGSVVHKMTEDYDNGFEVSILDDNGFIGYKLSEWNMFERYVDFRKKHDTNIIHNELNLVSGNLRMGGTIDRIMTVNGQLLLVDIKTSGAVHPHYWLQLAAYRMLLKDRMNMEVEGVAVLWLNAKTRTEGKAGSVQGKGWQLLIEKDTDKYFKLFEAAKTLWLAENEEQKPRQVSYSLSHKA